MALIAAAVAVPVVVALIVWVQVLGGGRSPDPGTVATASGTTAAGRDDLPVLPVAVPPVTPQADASCPALMKTLPLELMGEPSRRVTSNSPYAYAWGDPPVVLVCGVARPAGYVVGSSAIQINGVQWYVDTGPDATVWTTVDRPVYVQIRLPASIDSAPVTALTTQIATALPFREPTPGR